MVSPKQSQTVVEFPFIAFKFGTFLIAKIHIYLLGPFI